MSKSIDGRANSVTGQLSFEEPEGLGASPGEPGSRASSRGRRAERWVCHHYLAESPIVLFDRLPSPALSTQRSPHPTPSSGQRVARGKLPAGLLASQEKKAQEAVAESSRRSEVVFEPLSYPRLQPGLDAYAQLASLSRRRLFTELFAARSVLWPLHSSSPNPESGVPEGGGEGIEDVD
ncbi:uncharacterized protein BDW43DRAFT_310952 [Aspergillus alliaceus]|uniref:uncharacterized protein n=1 Tax=Petromyces alliaceus TaxID=209559 RepID=UPI0012A51CAC|nr:uncharacterized protein BDW43DRAFT_310952 [Aspergillus alliaceus]KAB8233597.1 hypothetical protein BDW43DRAFT_310952 [Aspergillus alliaceus]